MKICLSVIIIYLVFIINSVESNAYERIDEIFIERHKVFEKTDKDWFFAAPLLNWFHFTTFEYVIKDELLFKPGDLLDEVILSETERNLRATGLFTEVNIQIDSVGIDRYDIYIVTKDRWSTYPAILFGTGGGESNYGAALQEHNLFGTGTYLAVEYLYRTENKIGKQGFIGLKQNRFIRTELALDASLMANRFRTDQWLSLHKPFRTLRTRNSFGASALNSFGNEFLYNQSDNNYELMPYNEQKFNLWYGRAWTFTDRVFATALLEYQNVERGAEKYRQAYDNSGKFLLQFSSLSEKFYTISKVNGYHIEDMVIGGYGSATIGKIFPINENGENLFYVAGRGEQSYYNGTVYLYGQIAGGSAFSAERGAYTYQEFNGLGFYRFNESNLIAIKASQQSVWNWDALRQLILDNERGLRGYQLNQLTGDNRILINLEYRTFPDLRLFVYDISGVLFYDVGAVWDQFQQIPDTRFYNSVGAGLRFHFTKSSSPSHIFRLDFAYNASEKKFGGIIFTTKQLFSVFNNHIYRLPILYGTDIDVR